ncbi:immunoglobulin domain-containing protein [Dyadobacter pollutisoli]|uniref:Ig-like domain-containing protein n=1 Tax=Dyadobacter pollutisoli TaxID=2910158 RepID=A0A9E8NFG6_9BACT|nr:hypothetical protein [Dyadobacter pollutisoli]WAC13601.1 hypothetical protein ON006_06510 [Dyadobacter pollutisoli]
MAARLRIILTLLVLGFTIGDMLMGQPSNAVYADKQTNDGTAAGLGLTGSYSVTGADNVRNTLASPKPNNSFATLTASSTAGISSAWIQLEFPSEVTSSAGSPTTVYLRTNNNNSSLLGGRLAVTAYDKNNNAVSLVSSTFSTYYLADGTVLISVSPTATFKFVRVTVSSPILFGTNSLQVYYGFYGPTASNTSNPYPFNVVDCGRPNVTTKDHSGLTLGSFEVQNAGDAIDESTTTKSSFVSTGAALLGGHIKQTFFFNGVSNPSDAVRVILSQSGSFLAANVAASVTLQAYSGNSSVGISKLVNDLLDVQLLTLLGGNDNAVTFYFAPKDASGNSVIFDRVELDLNIALLGVGLGANGINVHDVRRSPDVAGASNVSTCSNIGTVALSALSPQFNIGGIGTFSYAWYTDIRSGTLLSSQQTWTALGLNTPGQVDYYVETQKSGTGCIASPRKKVTITVIAPPTSPSIALVP